MLLGLTRPDEGTVSVFGHSPEGAVDAGTVGAMLQTGSLIRDLSVRELVTMIASLYPEPLEVDDALELAGIAVRDTEAPRDVDLPRELFTTDALPLIVCSDIVTETSKQHPVAGVCNGEGNTYSTPFTESGRVGESTETTETTEVTETTENVEITEITETTENVEITPEPATLVLFGSGLAIAAARLRRRKAQQ